MPVSHGTSPEQVRSNIHAVEEKLNDHQSQTPINNCPAVRGGAGGSHFEGCKKGK